MSDGSHNRRLDPMEIYGLRNRQIFGDIAELRLIIDTDPGVDDAIAILMALAAPEVEVVGLTTLGGNVPRARATRNALALLQAAGRPDIPVAAGAARPRPIDKLRGRFRPSVAFHGPGGLSVRLPEPVRRPVPETAVDFLHRNIQARPNEITLAALGPLTNLSRVEARHQGVLLRASNLVIMGGAVETRGNVTPHAEFNFHSDPLAADHVLSRGVSATLADLAACRQVSISRDEAARINARSGIGDLALRVLRGWFDRDPERRRFEFYDPLAVALALEPAIATVRKISLRVDATDGEGRGESLISGEPGPVSLALEVDSRRFFALLGELFDWQGL